MLAMTTTTRDAAADEHDDGNDEQQAATARSRHCTHHNVLLFVYRINIYETWNERK